MIRMNETKPGHQVVHQGNLRASAVANRQIDTLIGPYEGFAPSRQILLMKAVRRLPPLLRSHQRIPCGQTASYVYGGRNKGYSLRA